MTKKGLNQNAIKVRNRSKVLKILRNEKGMSRKDIADQMGLSKAAISIIISELIDENIIIEKGSKETGVIGRNKMIVELNNNYCYVLGLSISEIQLTLLVSNILGETIDIYSHKFSENDHYNNEEILNLIIDKGLYLLWNNEIDRKNVLGFGIGYIGEMVKIDIDYIISQVCEKMKLKVVSDNNVKALAMSEMDFTLQNTSDNFLFVKYGPGLGMAIVQNGKIMQGANNRIAEIGHTIVDETANTSCRCGRKGCLESLISEKEIVKEIEKLGSEYSHLIIDKNLSIIDYESVNKLLELKDKAITVIFEQRYDYFAKSLANSCILFDPEYICVYGSIFSQPKILEMINERTNKYLGLKTNAEIKLSNLDSNNNAIGPVALALRKLFYNKGGYIEEN